MSLVTIQSFETSAEANLVKSKLQSERITCYLMNENFATLVPLYNVASGGIKLQVNINEVEDALEVLKGYQRTPLLDDQDKELKCPRCGSTDILNGLNSAKNLLGIIATLFTMILAIYPLYYNPVYKCRECGKEFS